MLWLSFYHYSCFISIFLAVGDEDEAKVFGVDLEVNNETDCDFMDFRLLLLSPNLIPREESLSSLV